MPELEIVNKAADPVEDFITTARDRFRAASEDEESIRKEARIDLRFVAGDQWDEGVKAERIRFNRPCLTFSRAHTFVQQVSNEARQNKPQVKFVPGDGGDPDTAEIYEGLARHIQYDSDAQIAYETAVEYSAGGSFGYFRFKTQYCSDDSWDLDLKVFPVFDPFSVYGILVPACFGIEPKFAFVIEDIAKEEFKRLYPESEITTLGLEAAGNRCPGWIGTETVRIAEYWYVDETPKVLKHPTDESLDRTVMQKKVKFCKISGLEVLPNTETDWPGSTIPIIPVLGKQLIVDGRPELFSVIRFQRDPQRMINLYKTRIAETLGVAPISPWIAATGQIPREHRAAWEQSNVRNVAVLEYDAKTVDGKIIGEPKRNTFEPPIASLSEAAMQEVDDMKATTGIYDASLGARSNVVSGLAKKQDMQQSNATNMHILDNLERSFKKAGVVMQEVMPIVYDTKRTIRILGQDEAPKIVKINQEFKEGQKSKHYKVGGDYAGKYDVVVTMGKSFSTKRMESFDMMSGVLQASPNSFPLIADIMFANSDLAGADQLAERFKRMLPPQAQDPQDGQEMPPQAQQAIMQSKQEAQLLNAHAQQLEQQIQQLQFEKQAKVIEKEYAITIEKLKIEADLAKAEIMTKAQSAQTRAKLEADIWAQIHGSGVDAGAQAADHAHDYAMSQVGAQQAQQQQADQQAHEAVMAAQSQAAQQQEGASGD